jgi:predicted membrane channel-forming protein YqfA (hemolysin III family)
MLGIASLIAAAFLAFALIASDSPRWARLAVFLPVWMAGLGLSEAREKT